LQRWLSHEQLARALRISPKELRDHERAVKRASCGRLYEIADALQVPITYLLFQSCTYGWRSLRMSLLWLCYRSREGGIRVVVQEATSLVHARLKVAVAGLAEHDAYTEGHHLMRACRSERPRSWSADCFRRRSEGAPRAVRGLAVESRRAASAYRCADRDRMQGSWRARRRRGMRPNGVSRIKPNAKRLASTSTRTRESLGFVGT